MPATMTQKEKAENLLALHHSEKPLMLPNIWDPLGAALLEQEGFKAVATSSSAVALTNGYLDGENIPFAALLALLSRTTQAVSIPVTADIEKGFAKDEKELENNINALLDTGIAGFNLEDGVKGQKALVPIEEQCQKIKLVREIAAHRNIPLVLNARTDTYIHSNLFTDKTAQLAETIKRGKAYKAAGADCFFPILLKDETAIKTIVAQVSLPINIMILPHVPSFKTLINAGVKRISLGSSFLKIAVQAMKKEALLLKKFEGQPEIDSNEIDSRYLESLIDKEN